MGQSTDPFVCSRNIGSFTIWPVPFFLVMVRPLLVYGIEEVYHYLRIVSHGVFTTEAQNSVLLAFKSDAQQNLVF